ncbi:MAG: GNAT family N-acetyltransferase [Bradymonadaceae bacterium]|nr:GNAT family N-acetyltransferase [Lujinxingiaceae bacterium]
MAVQQLTDRGELREFLMRDRIANAYLLGNLDPAYFQFCRWYGSRTASGELGNLLLIYRGLSLPVVFMSGSDPGIETFLRECTTVLPDRFHFHVLENHMNTVRDTFSPPDFKPMYRMGLERSRFSTHGDTSRVVRLGHRDTAAIMALYAHYPDNFFEPYQLETGLYFGIRDPALGLVSIAGVHVVSEEHDVAVIGNLVTHRQARGQGLATACTARLLEEIFERVSLVALNVQQDNEPAIRMYRHFGFEFNNVFFEGQYALGVKVP